MNAYWRLRHLVWDIREWLFVREAMRQLRHDAVVYIHPRTGGESKAALVRRDLVRQALMGVEPHGHLEGRRRHDLVARGPFVTASGRVLTDADFEALADEAERGHGGES